MSVPLDLPHYGASWGVATARFFGNYAVFRGRASRSEFWWWALTNALITIGLNVLAGMFGDDGWRNGSLLLPMGAGPGGPVTDIPGVIALVYSLGTLLPSLALTWRRLHDTDRSGGWFFLLFVPLVGPIILLVFLIGHQRETGRRFD